RGMPFKDASKNSRIVRATRFERASSHEMRHEAKNIPLRIADSRDVIFGPIGVPRFRRASPCVAVAEQDAAIQLKLLQQGLIGEITAFAMGDGKAQNRSRPHRIGERAVMALDPDMNVLANEVQSAIPD